MVHPGDQLTAGDAREEARPAMGFQACEGRGFCGVALIQPKTPANVGHALRAVGCYGASLMIVEGQRGHKSLITSNATDTMKAWRHIPTILTDDVFDAIPIGAVPVAVDLMPHAGSLVDFIHPQSAVYIFGPEDGTLGERHAKLGMARIYVPTRFCMNLAATVNVVLYDRMVKAIRRKALLTDGASTRQDGTVKAASGMNT